MTVKSTPENRTWKTNWVSVLVIVGVIVSVESPKSHKRKKKKKTTIAL